MRDDTFIGPRKLSKITLRVTHDKRPWKGERGGMYIYIGLTHQPTLENLQVEYRATMFQNIYKGTVGTVAEAVQQLEAVWLENRFARR